MMLFTVGRTNVSEYGDVQPCEEARQLKVSDLDYVWVVTIENLAELMAFQSKYGDIIIRDGSTGWIHIEIYDDNRE